MSSATLPVAGETWFVPATTPASPSSWFAWRVRIRVDNLGEPVLVRLAVDSKYWLHVNGVPVIREGSLKRGPAPGKTWGDDLDLTPWLRPGDNLLAIHHWYFGRHGFSHADSGDAVLHFRLLSGNACVSRSWKVIRDPAFFDAGTVRPGSVLGYRLPENSIGHDARHALGDWTSATFDDTAWPEPADAPANVRSSVLPRPIPQFFWRERTTAPVPPGVRDGLGCTLYRVALPCNLQFTPYFKIKARAGLKIRILSDSPEHCLTAEYITRDGDQEWESPGWLNGHEIIFHMPDSIKVQLLGYRETGYDCALSGKFSCGDAGLDELWRRSLRTLHLTMRDTFMDCPDRERAQWWGDEVIQLGQVFYSLGPSAHALVRKGILELAAWQRADGVLYSPIPSGNCFRELPLQSLASIGRYGIFEYVLHTGDKETARAVFPALQRYLALWATDAATGLPVARDGDWRWGDWGQNCDYETLTACWFRLALDGVAALASRLGETACAGALSYRARRLAEAVRRYCRTAEGSFRSPSHDGPPDDRANALAVLCGFHDPQDAPALADLLFRERHASPYMEKYVLESLFALGRADLALRRMRERYRGMLAMPVTTLPELFPESGQPNSTYNHSWSGAPLLVLSRYVAGLEPLCDAWREIRFCPQPGGLARFDVAFETPAGPVQASYRTGNGRFSIDLEIPADTWVECDFRHVLASTPATDDIPVYSRLPGGRHSFSGPALSLCP
ncbi:glycoside hydrolase [Opitutaceae bacterium TAV5]|nr:glycoside hydrolase [Opitutaceae bacterium TAV5]